MSLIDAPSAIRPDASGSIHLWGLAATTDGNGALAGLLKQNNNSGQIITAVACQVNGPFFMAFDAPVKLPLNASLYWDELAVTGTYPFISVFYTIMWEKGRK